MSGQIIRYTTPAVTPMLPEGGVDFASCERLYDHLIRGGGKRQRADPWEERLRELWQECRRKRRELGLPTGLAEAKAAGMTAGELWDLYEKNGVDLPQGDPVLLELRS